jgi:ribosome-binding protein aMBF1 (putative translation factor)
MPSHNHVPDVPEGRSLFDELEKERDHAITRGRRIAAARRSKGWAQEDLAQKTGLRVSTISRIERGISLHPQPRTLKVLARILRIDLG